MLPTGMVMPYTWLLALCVFGISAMLTLLGIGYAERRALLDMPGRRRSHATPTPRGGGIGIVGSVVIVIIAMSVPLSSSSRWPGAALCVAVALVAGVGWLDDHRGVSARARLVIHAIAAMLMLAAPFGMILGATASPGMRVLASFAAVIPLLGIVWSINLHNFMDGINGILAVQAIFVLFVLAGCFAHAGDDVAAQTVSLFALAVAGFLPFNFPRARVFMGDVGSGTLGLIIAICVLWQMTSRQIAMASGIVACSAFVVDATLTLLSRVLRGRRWYSAHREHLYQWLVRSGFSHVQVVAMYMAWNLLIVLPIIVLMNRPISEPAPWPMPPGTAFAAITYAIAATTWWVGKRACLRACKGRRSHGA